MQFNLYCIFKTLACQHSILGWTQNNCCIYCKTIIPYKLGLSLFILIAVRIKQRKKGWLENVEKNVEKCLKKERERERVIITLREVLPITDLEWLFLKSNSFTFRNSFAEDWSLFKQLFYVQRWKIPKQSTSAADTAVMI